MAWVVDTCVLIDVLEDDPSFGELSARTLDTHAKDGLVVCPVTYVEAAPAFEGNRSFLEEFLDAVGISYREDWSWHDTVAAHVAWHAYIRRRRAKKVSRRPVADILIGSFALRFQGLVTRNAGDFRSAFPNLKLLIPGSDESRQDESPVAEPEAPEVAKSEASGSGEAPSPGEPEASGSKTAD
jgi:predicted nucleic acid-binding protein